MTDQQPAAPSAHDPFGPAPFDRCDRRQHYAKCGRYRPFERCTFGSHWHHVDDSDTAYRIVEDCPNATEYHEPAAQPCGPHSSRIRLVTRRVR